MKSMTPYGITWLEGVKNSGNDLQDEGKWYKKGTENPTR
jgi:hypothetical protein